MSWDGRWVAYFMCLTGHNAAAGRFRLRWRGLVVGLAVASLVITLANRVFNSSSSETVTAQCHSPQAKIQHRDNDACRWAAPVARLQLLPASAPAPGLVYEDEPLRVTHVDGSLYDRPPPIS
jgi:hypothetical protein